MRFEPTPSPKTAAQTANSSLVARPFGQPPQIAAISNPPQPKLELSTAAPQTATPISWDTPRFNPPESPQLPLLQRQAVLDEAAPAKLGLALEPKLPAPPPLQRQAVLDEAAPAKLGLALEPKLPAPPPLHRQIIPGNPQASQPISQPPEPSAGRGVSPELETAIQHARSSGRPLADSVRSPMEQAFGADFRGVKIHADAQADQMNRSIQAKAFTTGQDIFFRQGAYAPDHRAGQQLLAHELTHVMQQNGPAVQRNWDEPLTQAPELNLPEPQSSLEQTPEGREGAPEAEAEELPLAGLQQRVTIAIDEDEQPETEAEATEPRTESHLLFVNPEDGNLWLHSDAQTLANFIKKKHAKDTKKVNQKLLNEIEQAASLIHLGRYGTKKTGGKKAQAPTKLQRQQAQANLKIIAQKLQQLVGILNSQRPPSHKAEHRIKKIGGDEFCEKIVMEPLSIMPRDDGIAGSSPYEETDLWRDLTQIAGYKRGHMLNEKLHGPGSNDNLVPISTAFNSTMREGIEKVTKQAVNAENKVVRFEAEARNWGNFLNANGFPDEKKLPSEFYFSVTQMKRKKVSGFKVGDGSKTGDWENTTKKIYKDTALVAHDRPNDYLSGITNPVVKTFTPGLYFHPGGLIKPISNTATDKFYLKGSFSIRNDPSLMPGLGLDPKTSSSVIYESFQTEYRVPPPLQIEKPFTPREVEYISWDSIKKIPTPDPAFLVYDPIDRSQRLKDFENEKKTFIEQQKQQQQQKLNQEQQRQFELEEAKKKQQKEQDEREFAKKQQLEFVEKSTAFRRQLLATIRNETKAKYAADPTLDEASLDLFLNGKLEEVLYDANEFNWKPDTKLFEKDLDSLLNPVRQKIAAIHRESEENVQIKQELLTKLAALSDDLLTQLKMRESKAQFTGIAAEFEQEVEQIQAEFDERWTKSSLAKYPPEAFLKDPCKRIQEEFKEALKTLEKATEKLRLKQALLQKVFDFDQEIKARFSEGIYKKFHPDACEIDDAYAKFWEQQDVKSLSNKFDELWESAHKKLLAALKKAQKTEQSQIPAANFMAEASSTKQSQSSQLRDSKPSSKRPQKKVKGEGIDKEMQEEKVEEVLSPEENQQVLDQLLQAFKDFDSFVQQQHPDAYPLFKPALIEIYEKYHEYWSRSEVFPTLSAQKRRKYWDSAEGKLQAALLTALDKSSSGNKSPSGGMKRRLEEDN